MPLTLDMLEMLNTLDGMRLPDALLGEGYEATSPEHRGWIKTTLALVEATYPALPSCSEQRTESLAAGYGNRVRRTVAPWAALVIGTADTSAIRLAAAIMSARLAGVEPLVAIWTGWPLPPGAPAMPSALLAALELTGVEQSFVLPDASPLLARLHQTGGRGRVLGFGLAQDNPPGKTDDMRATAHRLDIPLWEDPCPCLGVPDPAAFDLATIRWAHPDAHVVPLPAPATNTAPVCCDALYAPDDAAVPPVRTGLRLSPGLEGAWVCPDLPPSFFMNTEMSLYCL